MRDLRERRATSTARRAAIHPKCQPLSGRTETGPPRESQFAAAMSRRAPAFREGRAPEDEGGATTQAPNKTAMQSWAIVTKCALLRTRGSLMWFGLLEMVLPLTILLCMYIPNWILSTSTARDVVPERVSMPRAIMDVRWTQSKENYCRHLYSSTEGDSMRLGVPTKMGYVSHGSALSETIAYQAAAYLLCETTPEEDFALQNLTSVSSHFPPAFLTVLGLDELGTRDRCRKSALRSHRAGTLSDGWHRQKLYGR